MSSTDQHDTKSAPHEITHIALKIEDIIDQILLKLVEDENAKKKDLLSMARSCKAFKDPSLNRLWENMNSVKPLLKLIDGIEESRGTLILADDVEYGELSLRFHGYARRVRVLEYDLTSNFADIDIPTWIRLAQVEYPLFPNLTSLKISCTLVEDAAATQRNKALLLLPVLVRLSSIKTFTFKIPSVTSYEARFEVGPFLSIMGGYGLSIETIDLSGTFNIKQISRILTMHSLRSVSLQLARDSAIPALLTAMASLPRLYILHLEYTGLLSNSAEMEPRSFQDLQKITLKGGTSFVSRTLASMICPCIEHINVHLLSLNISRVTDVPPTQESILPYLQLSRFPTLRKLLLDLSGCVLPTPYGPRQNRLNFVAPILGNRKMEEFVVTCLDSQMCFSNHEIVEIATAWPLLRVLRLEHVHPPVDHPSFESLGYLVARCPHLSEVSMTLCEGDIERIDDYVTRTPGVNVWELNLQHTSVTQYAVIGRYIDELFPFLNRFTMVKQQECTYVRDIIFKACKIARRGKRYLK